MMLFALFYRQLYQANIMMNYMHLPIHRIMKKLRRNKVLVQASVGFLIIIQVLFVSRNFLSQSQNFAFDSFTKNAQLIQGIFYSLSYIVLGFFSIKMTKMSFNYIDILDTRYFINSFRIKLILASVCAPLICGFLIGVYLSVVWLFHMYKGTNCSPFYAGIYTYNYGFMTWCTQAMPLLVIWIVWFLVSELKIRDDDDSQNGAISEEGSKKNATFIRVATGIIGNSQFFDEEQIID